MKGDWWNLAKGVASWEHLVRVERFSALTVFLKKEMIGGDVQRLSGER